MPNTPTIWWVGRDLRLADNAALAASCAGGGPVIPVFIRDELFDGLGAAPMYRFGRGLDAFDEALHGVGSRLICRSGDALEVLRALVAETGAGAVVWSRRYDPASIARDKRVKAALGEDGVQARSYPGFLLFEPWTVETGQGGPYKVYSPYWRAVSGREVAEGLAAPGRISAPKAWPDSEALADWQLGAAMRRGAGIVAPHLAVGEGAAQDRLARFLDGPIEGYKDRRNFPGEEATSRLSENLTYGEISPAAIWRAGQAAEAHGARGAGHFLKELVWREFAWHLLYHFPDLDRENWKDGWQAFPWRGADDNAELTAWQQGRTGIELVDAGLREMYVTGTMHNRVRMVVASYLTKHLLTDWRDGLAWFADCLVDWDPASNAMGWQWVAGCGPDAAPYFRIFNPDTQAEKFDPDGTYRARWLAEGREAPSDTALSYFDAVPKGWGLSPDDPRPEPAPLKVGRERALAAYEQREG